MWGQGGELIFIVFMMAIMLAISGVSIFIFWRQFAKEKAATKQQRDGVNRENADD